MALALIGAADRRGPRLRADRAAGGGADPAAVAVRLERVPGDERHRLRRGRVAVRGDHVPAALSADRAWARRRRNRG